MKRVPHLLMLVLAGALALGTVACAGGNQLSLKKKSHNCIKPNNHK
jgi:hypothetical protein